MAGAAAGDATTALSSLFGIGGLSRPSVDSGTETRPPSSVRPSVQPPPTDTARFNSEQVKDRDIFKGGISHVTAVADTYGLLLLLTG